MHRVTTAYAGPFDQVEGSVENVGVERVQDAGTRKLPCGCHRLDSWLTTHPVEDEFLDSLDARVQAVFWALEPGQEGHALRSPGMVTSGCQEEDRGIYEPCTHQESSAS